MGMAFKFYAQLMRWDKPIGSLLLLWPTLAALWLASGGLPSWRMIVIFTLGVFVMRSAGCVINDIADRKFDRHVARTQQRPLTTGNVSLMQAWLLFLSLASIAFFLVLQLNHITIALAPWVLLCVIIYPFTKRFTYWPQAVLGLTFYTSILMAFTAVQNHLSYIAIIFYISAVLWAIVYDTQYAMADREDDKKIAIKSTAILFEQHDCSIIGLLQVLVLLTWCILGLLIHATLFYFIALGGIILLMGYQQYLLQRKNTADYFKAFLNNHWIGLALFLGVAVTVK
jgi:4-hydroxybenzoate polyprenyltransferase